MRKGDVQLSTVVMAVLVVGLLATGAVTMIGDYQSKFDFNTSAEFSTFYSDINSTHERTYSAYSNVQNRTGFISKAGGLLWDLGVSIPRLVIDSIFIPLKMIDASLQTLGVPTSSPIAKVLVTMVIISILFAIVALIWGRQK